MAPKTRYSGSDRSGVPLWAYVIFGLSAVIIFLVLLQLYNLSLFRGSVDYNRFGDLATWFAGFLTFGAVAIALRESFRAGARESAEADRHATSVVPWLEIGSESWLLRVDNQTGRPVEAWMIEFKSEDVHICWRDAGPCAPRLTTLSLERVPNLPAAISSNFPYYAFTFVDGAERVWTREPSGRLLRAAMSVEQFRNHDCPDGRLAQIEGS